MKQFGAGRDFSRFNTGQAKELQKAFLEAGNVTLSATNGAAAGALGSGGFYETAVETVGGLIRTTIFIDITGLGSSTTDGDIIGVGSSPAYIAKIDTSVMGTDLSGSMTCLEVPATGADDIDLYLATEGTGVFDGAIGSLTETQLVSSAAAWTSGRTLGFAAQPSNGVYLYLVNGEAGTANTYTAGRFLLTLIGRNPNF